MTYLVEKVLLQGMPKDGVTDQQVDLQWKALMEFFKAGGVVPLLANVSNPTLMVQAFPPPPNVNVILRKLERDARKPW